MPVDDEELYAEDTRRYRWIIEGYKPVSALICGYLHAGGIAGKLEDRFEIKQYMVDCF